jgi:hypothetical protein
MCKWLPSVLERIDNALLRSPRRCSAASSLSIAHARGVPVGDETSRAHKESDCFLRCAYTVAWEGGTQR